MGCGQSKIVNLYPKNKKNKNSGSKRNGFSIRSTSIEQKNENAGSKSNKTNNNGADVNRNDGQNESFDKSQAKKKPNAPGGGPLLQQTEISTSQLDFFRMLDEKIENGPDYDENADAPSRAEHASSLLHHWQLASISWSNINDVDGSNALNLDQPYPRHLQHQPYVRQFSTWKPTPVQDLRNVGLSVKDRESMRNIIGGRPESAPIYVQRMNSAKRVDGLQDVMSYHQHHHHHHHQQQQQQHYPSPNMPRHVLESISQSPTQSSKTSPGISSPTAVSRYSHYQHPDLQQQPVKLTRTQLVQTGQLNEDYTNRDYDREQQFDSSPRSRNSLINPYIHQVQITASSSSQLLGQQYTGPRRRGTGNDGSFDASQMT